KLYVLYLTTGVPAPAALWPWQRAHYDMRVARRRAEAEAAAALIGLEPARFLGWPSRQLRFHLDAALAEIERAVDAARADSLWVPAFEGGHQDHDAASALASRLLRPSLLWEFAAYNFAGGRVWANRFAG